MRHPPALPRPAAPFPRSRLAALPPLLVALSALVVAPADAITRGTGAAGVTWQSGGIGDEEIAAMRADFAANDLWVTTAAQRSGAYLAGVHLHVRDARGALVLNVDMDGPWLLATLPPGRYEIEATLMEDKTTGRLEVQRATTEVTGKGLRQVILYFGTGDEVSTERDAAGAVAPPSK